MFQEYFRGTPIAFTKRVGLIQISEYAGKTLTKALTINILPRSRSYA